MIILQKKTWKNINPNWRQILDHLQSIKNWKLRIWKKMHYLI